MGRVLPKLRPAYETSTHAICICKNCPYLPLHISECGLEETNMTSCKLSGLCPWNKKLCRCKGTAQRTTNTKYRTWKVCNGTLKVITTAAIQQAVYKYHFLLVACCYNILSSTVSQILQLIQCTWLSVTLRSPSPVTIKFNHKPRTLSNLSVNTLQLKHAVFPELWVLQRFKTAKVTVTLTQGHWQSSHSIGHTWFPVSLPLYITGTTTATRKLCYRKDDRRMRRQK